MRKQPMTSHGVRLAPATWRKIERLAEAAGTDRTDWLREQIEALLSRIPDVPNSHGFDSVMHGETVEVA